MSKRCRTCLECAKYIPAHEEVQGRIEEFSGFFVPNIVKIPHTCKEHPEVMEDWWNKYADIPTNLLTKDLELPCFELTEYGKCLDNCINLAEEILDGLNKKTDGEK